MGLDWGKWRDSGVHVGLVLLARDAALDILVHKL